GPGERRGTWGVATMTGWAVSREGDGGGSGAGGAGTTKFCAATSSARSTRIVRCKLRRPDRMRYLLHRAARRDGQSKEVPSMPESHRLIVDRHEGDLAVVEVDGGPTL